MPAYLVYICRDVQDRKDMETYWEVTKPTFEGRGMKVHVGYTPFELLESDGQPVEGIVIAEFPSMEAAKDWYDSPGYREARKYRMRGAKYLGLLVQDGVMPVDERMPQTKGRMTGTTGS